MGTEIHLHAQCVRLEEENQILRDGIKAVRELIDNSEGVAGLNLSGNTALWHELERHGYFEDWLLPFNAAEDII